MADFYKMDPADWDNGTARLTLEEEAAYLRIVNSIHKHKGPVPDVDRVLAGMFRTSTRKARSLISALIGAGKIIIEDGAIWNDRARSDLVHRGFVSVSRAESGAKGGRMSAELRAKSLETKEPEQANASPREEKRREENTEAKASVASKRGSRLSAEWFLPRDWGDWAISEGLVDDEIRSEADRFRDYWIGVAGAKGVKADWSATWRNWIRKFIADNRKGKENGKTDRRQFDAAINETARRLSQGTISLDHSSRDPFAAQ
jgi:uncharacterized protein YdaU (DUF1376 family)